MPDPAPVPFSYAAYAAEVADDPAGLGLAGMTRAARVAALNAPDPRWPVHRRWVPIAELEGLVISALPGVEDAAADATTPGPLRAACRTLLRLIDSTRLEQYDADDPRFAAGLDAMAAAGLVDAAARDAVLALASVPASRAAHLWADEAGGPKIVTGDDDGRSWHP